MLFFHARKRKIWQFARGSRLDAGRSAKPGHKAAQHKFQITHALLMKNVQNNATIPILIHDLILICLCCPQNRPTGQRRLWSEKAVRPFPAYPTWPEACSQIPVPAVPGVLLQPLCVGIPAAIPCTWREKRTCVPLVLQVHGQIHVAPQCQINLQISNCCIDTVKKRNNTTKTKTK